MQVVKPSPVARVDADDETLAVHSHLPLLITGDCGRAVSAVATRVHSTKFNGASSLAQAGAGAFPIDARHLLRHCSMLLDAGAGGSIFITDVEQLPRKVQDVLMGVLASLRAGSRRAPPVRLMTGTTVSLRECVDRGVFSEELFYRLNAIHLVVKPEAVATLAT